MDKFGKIKLTKKKTFAKSMFFDWYSWFINYIPMPIKRPWVRLKTEL